MGRHLACRNFAAPLLLGLTFLSLALPAGAAVDITKNQIGRLTSIGNGHMRVYHQYDDRGRSVGTQHVQDGRSSVFATRYGYPQNPAATSGPGMVIVKETFPDGEEISYTHDATGQIITMRVTFGGLTEDILRDLRLNARGLVTSSELGNLTATTYTYDEGAGGHLRLKRLRTVNAAGQVVQDYGYEYDANGNVTATTDGVRSDQSFTLEYDSRGQLTAMLNSAGSVLERYVYDAIGNLTQKGSLAQTYNAGGRPHALASSGGVGYQYDPNGNVIAIGANVTLEWSAENMPRKVTAGTNVTEKWHIGEALWKRVENGAATYYLPSMRVENGVARKYYGAYAERSEQPGDRQLRFYHPDHLGSSSVMTDKNGNVIRRVSYLPWGQDRGVEGTFTPKLQFNGKEKETATGFYDYGARLYNPATGRWLSPDRFLVDGMNRYAYVRNNPWSRFDPTGNFSPPVHRYILAKAFPYMRRDLFLAMVRGSHAVDGATLDNPFPSTLRIVNAHKHSMIGADVLASVNGDMVAATKIMESRRAEFIKGKKAEIRALMAQYDEAVRNGNAMNAQGLLEDAHFKFGELTHPLKDAKSDGHRGKVYAGPKPSMPFDYLGQVWEHVVFWSDMLKHSRGEDEVHEIPDDVWTDTVPTEHAVYRELFGDRRFSLTQRPLRNQEPNDGGRIID